MPEYDPFARFELEPLDRYLEGTDPDINPARPPSQGRKLWEIVAKHFPGTNYETDIYRGHSAFQLVMDCDDMICHYCSHFAILTLPPKGSKQKLKKTYPSKQSVATVLKRKIRAIDNQNVRAWLKAENETTGAVRKAEHKAAKELDLVGRLLHECCVLTLGPSAESLSRNPDLWKSERAILQRALDSLGKGGRRQSDDVDDAVRTVVQLWEYLSGEQARQPSYEAGSSRRAGSMVQFVEDVMQLYAPFGMAGAVKNNSGAFWKRILPKKPEFSGRN